ncbi:YjzC family protein [Halobacillus alkaliphilus]|nr:YjzC family protein [Halobacillus alkaliphilus]
MKRSFQLWADRFKTGEKARENGTYEFDGLVNEGNENDVTEDEIILN